MDSFKEFIQKMLMKTELGTPFQVSQGEHSKPKPRLNLGSPFRVSQGEHSKPIKPLKEEEKVKLPTKGDIIDHVAEHLNPHIGQTPDEVEKHLHDHYDVKSNPDWEHIRKYTAQSEPYNTYLFRHHAEHNDPYHPLSQHKDMIEGMDRALSRHQLHIPLKVISGLKKNPGLQMGENKRLYHPGFLSTSINPRIANNFSVKLKKNSNDPGNYNTPGEDHHLVIHLQPGQHGAYVGKHSEFDSEKELIMPRRSIFQIQDHEVHPIQNLYTGEPNHLHYWHATVVNPDGKP